MKYLKIIAIAFLVLNSCKKEERLKDSDRYEDSLKAGEDLPVDSLNLKSPAFEVESLVEAAEKGKTVFTDNGKTIFYFSTVKNLGSIKIDGKTYTLDQLNFVDNEYFISGPEVKISAKEGIFQEMTGDCLYGTFPQLTIDLDGKTETLKNIKVQDCPQY